MGGLNWNAFVALPGAADSNFEALCRGIIKRHYSRYGEFRALANQPGVEFHLKLKTECELGMPPQWFGWQCKWYGLQNGQNLGSTRRKNIREGIEKTEKHLPGITDWILCTRHTLTKEDQNWFYGLRSSMKLHLWTESDIDDLLSGPAVVLRDTYFDQLILLPESLKNIHDKSVAPIRKRWISAAHQVSQAEQDIYAALVDRNAWNKLEEIQTRLSSELTSIVSREKTIPQDLQIDYAKCRKLGELAVSELAKSLELLGDGSFESLAQSLKDTAQLNADYPAILNKLRSRRHPLSIEITNLLSDLKSAKRLLAELSHTLSIRCLVVIADAGYGKTQMSAEITSANATRSAGIFLRGKNLRAGDTLDDFAHHVSINAQPVQSFEALVAAVNAAAERQAKCLPIIIDGLNEAEDPRDWKELLSPIPQVLENYNNVRLIVTVRSSFVDTAIPEEFPRLHLSGFEEHLIDAVRKYFRVFKIDPRDADLPLDLLNHPLTLRIFCEVTNFDRKHMVGVGAMPASLRVLFEQYIIQVAKRIAELSSRSHRYFESDVRSALDKIGVLLWEKRSREVEIENLRALLGDSARPWNQSIVAALEDDGILFREPGYANSHGNVSLIFDALAGHVIAESMVGKYQGLEFDKWVKNPGTVELLNPASIEKRGYLVQSYSKIRKWIPDRWLSKIDSKILYTPARRSKSHPLSADVLVALVGVVPAKLNRRHLWEIVSEPLRSRALVDTAFIDGELLDHKTVSALTPLIRSNEYMHRDLKRRLLTTRASQAHPLNAIFLHNTLLPMPMAERDLIWSEWLRRNDFLLNDIKRLSERWLKGNFDQQTDHLRARWVMWCLLSTNRTLRDHATHAIYAFGLNDPEALFELTLESLAINDPYVRERMLASCYGVGMSLWADPKGQKLRASITSFAQKIIEGMFAPGAVHSTFHALTKDYALGVIAVAKRLDATSFSEEALSWLQSPFSHISSPFPAAGEITNQQIIGAEDAIGMDFGNYTMGGLIRNRHNYDFENSSYKDVRRQIEFRITSLGYSPEKFRSIDLAIARQRGNYGRQSRATIDRYGKKYSWIAFFEMYGLRAARDEISEWRNRERPSEVDIDPSFPPEALTIDLILKNIFRQAPKKPLEWVAQGPSPDYSDLLHIKEFDGNPGPWVLLEGYIEQSATSDSRQIFSFLRGVIVDRKNATDLLNRFNTTEYPGNSAIPEPLNEIYTFGGEIPWSKNYASDLRDPDGGALSDIRKAFEYFGPKNSKGIAVEIPACTYSWESYHSELNKAGGVDVVAPALCEKLDLQNHQGGWDLFEKSGKLASIFRKFKGKGDSFNSHLLYLRADLASKYLGTSRNLVWFVWGERNLHYRDSESFRSSLSSVYSKYLHIHKYAKGWDGR